MSAPGAGRPGRLRRLALSLGVLAGLVAVWLRGGKLFTGGYGAVGSEDYVQYWAAARVVWRGGNPYSASTLLAEERAAGMTRDEPVLMWNPPWTLLLALPIAGLPFGHAVPIWLIAQLTILLGSGLLLWRYYAPGDRRYWAGLLLAAAFEPGLVALKMGQVSPWLLLGVVGFLIGERKQRDLVAGAALALLMIKPHFTYLFWMAALWWAWRERRRKVLLGYVAALALASTVVGILAPDVFADYLAAGASPPLQWATTTTGAWLRLALGPERYWLQFLPTVLGVCGLAIWLWRRRGPWQWQDLAASLLLASVVTAAYGWTFDQVVLLPVAVDLVSRIRQASLRRQLGVLGALAGFQVLLLVQNQLSMGWFFNAWYPPALAGLYALAARQGPWRDVKQTRGRTCPESS